MKRFYVILFAIMGFALIMQAQLVSRPISVNKSILPKVQIDKLMRKSSVMPTDANADMLKVYKKGVKTPVDFPNGKYYFATATNDTTYMIDSKPVEAGDLSGVYTMIAPSAFEGEETEYWDMTITKDASDPNKYWLHPICCINGLNSSEINPVYLEYVPLLDAYYIPMGQCLYGGPDQYYNLVLGGLSDDGPATEGYMELIETSNGIIRIVDLPYIIGAGDINNNKWWYQAYAEILGVTGPNRIIPLDDIEYITKEFGNPLSPVNISYTHPGKTSYTFDICNFNFKDWVYKNRWDQIEHDIYKLVNLSKEQFDKHYSAVLYDGTQELQQYEYNNSTKTFKKIDAPKKKGTIIEVPNEGVEETTVLQWSMTANEVKEYFFDKVDWRLDEYGNGTTTRSKNLKIAIKYQSDNEYERPSVYVYFDSNTFDITVKKPKATIDWSDARIANYWYEFGSMNRGTREIRTNTLSPEDAHVDNLKGKPFNNLLSDVFTGNQVISSKYVKLENAQYNDINWTLVFDEENNGKKFKGITGSGDKTYTLQVGDSELGKALYAYLNSPLDKELIATLVYKEGAEQTPNSTIIQYAHTEYAYALLNYKSSLDISGGESAKDILDIIVSLEAKMCEHDVSTYDNSFNVRFLRPINVEDNEMEITESTSSSTIINLRDLVRMSDWRSTEVYPIWRNENMDYWNYYNIKSIKVIGAPDEKEGSIINEYIYTNLGRGVYEGINKTNSYRLDNITDQVRFRYYPVQGPVAQYDKNNPTNYGYIEYINYGSETNDFKVLVPLKVEYEWGAVYCDATITIKTAEETTNSFFKEGTYNWNFGVSFDGTEYYSVVKPFNLDLEEKNYDMSNLSQSLVGVKANKWNIDGFLGFFPDATERQLPAYSYFQNIEGVDVEFLSVVDKDGLLSVGNIKIGTETYECYIGDISDDNKLYVDWLFATINDDVIYLGGTPCIFTFDGDAPVLLMDLKDLTILPNGTISETKSIRYGKPKPFDGKIVITGRSKFDYELVVSDKLKRFIRNR